VTITHVGPTAGSFAAVGKSHSFSGRVLSLAASADGQRLYAGTYAGVWRSDDAGRNWQQLTRPQPVSHDEDVAGAVHAPTVFDLAVSPVDVNLVIASGSGSPHVISRDGVYRSIDGGLTWTLVYTADLSLGEFVSQVVFAPDDPLLVYAAIGRAVIRSVNAGLSWTRRSVPGRAWHVGVGALEAGGVRRVFGVGSNTLCYSTNGGTTWRRDTGGAAMTAITDVGEKTANNSGSGASVVVVDPSNPQCVFLAGTSGANGPSYYAQRPDGTLVADGTICNTTPDRPCGEGSLWYGDYTQFGDGTTGAATWTQLPGPPVYWGATTPSGNSFVIAQPTAAGFLLVFADRSHVHICAGKPTGAVSWHRFDGKDASRTKTENDLHNRLFVHPDPHAIVVTRDFDLTLTPATGVPSPYDQNSVLAAHLGGTIWIANDGGVYRSTDGGASWELAHGLETLDPVNIAGVAGIGSRPALYVGTGDNDDFFSLNGGQTWLDPNTGCGDCGAWFSDLSVATRVLQFDGRGVGLRVRSGGGAYPNAASSGGSTNVKPPRGSNANTGPVLSGFKPLILTLATEPPPTDFDAVFIGMRTDNSIVLFRSRKLSQMSTVDDWENPAKAEQIGPKLPPGVTVAQVAGGHVHPVFFVTDGFRLFKLSADGTAWNTIVPGGQTGQMASAARRFFVNPFAPNVIYVLDDAAVKVSLNGGASWMVADSLTRAVTAGGRLTLNPSTAISDMLFVRSDPFTAFVFGHAGVSYTNDGVDWRLLLSAIAQPGLPEFGFFDGISDPLDRALYVTFTGRSVMRINPIAPRSQSQPQNFSLMELAAMIGDG